MRWEVIAAVAAAGCGRIGFDPIGGFDPDLIPSECDMRGLRAGAPWPMEAYCPAHVGRTPFDAPTTEPTLETYRLPGLELTPIIAMGIAIDADGTAYVQTGTANPIVLATDLRSQTPLWQISTQLGAAPSTPAIGADGTVWTICAADRTMWCGRTPQGTVVTIIPNGGGSEIRSGATIGGDGLLRWVDTTHGLHAAAPAVAGWSPARVPVAIDGSDPAVSLDGRTFIDDDRGVVWAYDANGGLATMHDPNLAPIGNFGTLPIVTSRGVAYAVSSVRAVVEATPDLASATVATLPVDVYGMAAAADGTLYVTDTNHDLHVIRGGLELQPAVEGWTDPILAANGVLLVGGDKTVIAYDVTRTPIRELWRHPISNADRVATVRLGIDGMIVVSTADTSVATGSVRVFE